MNNIVKNTLILTAITVVSGLLLGVVYDITKEPIAQAQENTKQEAYRTVLSDASEFETVEFDADSAASLLSENGYTSDVITEIAEGMDAGGATVGYVISVQSSEAYDGALSLSVGIASDGTVKGIEMLEIRLNLKTSSKTRTYRSLHIPRPVRTGMIRSTPSAARPSPPTRSPTQWTLHLSISRMS